MALTNAQRQAKHRAKRDRLLADCYMVTVQAALSAQGESSLLDHADSAVVQAGKRYGIGPYDCAAQIMANRQDARSVARENVDNVAAFRAWWEQFNTHLQAQGLAPAAWGDAMHYWEEGCDVTDATLALAASREG